MRKIISTLLISCAMAAITLCAQANPIEINSFNIAVPHLVIKKLQQNEESPVKHTVYVMVNYCGPYIALDIPVPIESLLFDVAIGIKIDKFAKEQNINFERMLLVS